MLMKLKKFQEALTMFERVLVINPLLAEGALEDSMRICREALATNSVGAPENFDVEQQKV